jgi:NAD(P)-dependent dehydrogenase (short-subunit alcohol dehydrogenase family)
MSPLPGSLSSTAALVRDTGQDALIVQGDLLDRASLGAAATKVLDTWGHVDVVVHNARYIGPGHMDRFLDTPIELLEKQLDGNVLAALVLNQLLLPSMIDHGGGTVVNITSASGYADPTKPAGDGGWGMGYGISKGAFQRIAGFLAVELGDQGIRCFNVQPGLIATERIAQDMAKFGIVNSGAPPEVIGAVVAWLCTSDEADEFNGLNIEAQYFCHERGLLPDWPGPRAQNNNIRYDRSGAILDELETKLAGG